MANLDMTPDQFRELGYRVIDILADHLAEIMDQPARPPIPDAVRSRLLEQELPETGQGAEELIERIAADVLAYPMGNASPRFYAWINSPPAPLGVLADLMASAHNASTAGGDHSAIYVEHAVLNWLKQMLAYPEESAGIITSGGSMANLIGLTVMRHVKATVPFNEVGFQGEAQNMVVYTSDQMHLSVQKAVQMLGIGRDYLRKIPTDEHYRLDVGALAAAIRVDREAGLRPVCVVASAGTVNTGAIDPLDAIADLCEQEDLWLHVDGAYGAVAAILEDLKPLYSGLERADSLCLDPHKWMYVPVECGCVLVRDAQAMRDTFAVSAPYVRDDQVLPWFMEFGPQQTRAFRALKLWTVMQQIGLQGYRHFIARDIELARTLRRKIEAARDFEWVAGDQLSIVCFQYTGGINGMSVDEVNRHLPKIMQRTGTVFLAGTDIKGRSVLRVCIVNFRTREEDLEILLDAVRVAAEVLRRGH